MYGIICVAIISTYGWGKKSCANAHLRNIKLLEADEVSRVLVQSYNEDIYFIYISVKRKLSEIIKVH